VTPTPVSILTGFLGSGKTTLLRRLLADPAMAETAVVVNELGEVGLDHLLVREITDDIVLLDSGCLCCAVRDDLVTALAELAGERAAGRIPWFRRVAVETTGLADPAPIVQTLISEPAIVARYRLASVAATVDAVLGASQLDRFAEAVKQAAMADTLVVTKGDLDPAGADALHRRLRALNPGASILTARPDGGPDAAAVFRDAALPEHARLTDVVRWLDAGAYARIGTGAPASARPGAIGAEAAGRHDSRVESFCIRLQKPVDWNDFVEWLDLLLGSRGESILRIKGLLDVAGSPVPKVIHAVQHVAHPPDTLAAWPDEDRCSRIVFITRDLPRAGVERSLRSVLGADALAPSH
jgi:G3E family GTPase